MGVGKKKAPAMGAFFGHTLKNGLLRTDSNSRTLKSLI